MDLERLNEALSWYDEVFGELDDIDKDAPRRVKHIADAARAYRDLLANGGLIAAARLVADGERVEVCGPHLSMWLNDDDGCEAAVGAQVKPWRNPCRKVSRLLSVYPKEAENG